MIQPWMRADPLMSLLLDRGYGAERAYEVVERVAWRVEGGTPEIQAIIETLGFCPIQIRDQLEKREAR